MPSGIRSRLMASYIGIISITLAIVFAALLLVPITRNAEARRMNNQLRQDLNRLREQLPVNFLPEDLEQRRQEIRNQLRPRYDFLVVTPKGTVLFASNNNLIKERIPMSALLNQGENMPNGQWPGPDGRGYYYTILPINAKQGRVFLLLIQPISPLFTSVWGGFVVAGGAAFALALLLSLVITRSVARPLQAIARGAETLAKGDYSQRVPVSGPREVQQLAHSFNEMSGEVQANQAAMRDFVANVSHELKTPLTSIQGFSQALLDGTAQNPQAQQKAAKIINDEAHRLRRLVDDFLDLARIEAGSLQISPQPINLKLLLSTAIDNFAPQLSGKQITLHQNITE